MIAIMLPKSDYLKLLELEPDVTFFYHDRPVFYTITDDGDNYMVTLAEEAVEGNPDIERFLIIHYPPEIFDLLQQGRLTIRNFFTHFSNTVHNALVEYDDDGEPVLVLGFPYDDNSAIPDEYLPTEDAPWLYILDPE